MVQHVRVAIAGTGFSGLGAAIRLRREGIDDFVLLERAGDVGGVWRDNTYPGCACDVQSHLYAFSFAPNPAWTRAYSPQPEILDYLRRCARDHGLLERVRFHSEVQSARWDGVWHLETATGPLTADLFVAAVGGLSAPSIPELPGLDRFTGVAMHSARWDPAWNPAGRRVAVVGTGASAIQFVPALQPRVEKLVIFQRTPPWIVPRNDKPISPRMRRLYAALPGLQRLVRGLIAGLREVLGVGFRHPALMRLAEAGARWHLRKSVRDPALRAKLLPDYRMGCKRILVSDDYLPAVAQDNVELVTSAVRELRERSVIAADGSEHAVDTIIFGTGFHVTDPPIARWIRGRDGRTLAEAWQGSMKAYLGTTIAGFPNFFLLPGPNTGLGHSSVVAMSEAQVGHFIDVVRHLARSGAAAVEPSAEAQAAFVREVDRAMRGTVWTEGGCASWYLDRTGRNSTLWPGSVRAFQRRAAQFDPAAYVPVSSGDPSAA